MSVGTKRLLPQGGNAIFAEGRFAGMIRFCYIWLKNRDSRQQHPSVLWV